MDYVCGSITYLLPLSFSFGALFATRCVYSLDTIRILFHVVNYSASMEHHQVINIILHSKFSQTLLVCLHGIQSGTGLIRNDVLRYLICDNDTMLITYVAPRRRKQPALATPTMGDESRLSKGS